MISIEVHLTNFNIWKCYLPLSRGFSTEEQTFARIFPRLTTDFVQSHNSWSSYHSRRMWTNDLQKREVCCRWNTSLNCSLFNRVYHLRSIASILTMANAHPFVFDDDRLSSLFTKYDSMLIGVFFKRLFFIVISLLDNKNTSIHSDPSHILMAFLTKFDEFWSWFCKHFFDDVIVGFSRSLFATITSVLSEVEGSDMNDSATVCCHKICAAIKCCLPIQQLQWKLDSFLIVSHPFIVQRDSPPLSKFQILMIQAYFFLRDAIPGIGEDSVICLIRPLAECCSFYQMESIWAVWRTCFFAISVGTIIPEFLHCLNNLQKIPTDKPCHLTWNRFSSPIYPCYRGTQKSNDHRSSDIAAVFLSWKNTQTGDCDFSQPRIT
jgi:hypothetical protein